MKKQKIALIGMGFLGSPLVLKLQSKYQNVIATKTQPFSLPETDLVTLPLDLYHLSQFQDTLQVLAEADLVIYDLPPLEPTLVEAFINVFSPQTKIICTSSISIYGPNRGDIDESFIVPENTTNAPIVFKIEQLFKARFQNLALLRLGGLYGNTPTHKRHPINFLSGKMNLKNGNEFLHLVNVEDCIQAIMTILDKDLFPSEINLISDLRITKREYYLRIAEKLKMPAPQFDEVEILTPTKISNKKSHEILGIDYLNPLNYQKN